MKRLICAQLALASIAACLTMSLVLVGCGGQPSNQSSTKPSTKPTTLIADAVSYFSRVLDIDKRTFAEGDRSPDLEYRIARYDQVRAALQNVVDGKIQHGDVVPCLVAGFANAQPEPGTYILGIMYLREGVEPSIRELRIRRDGRVLAQAPGRVLALSPREQADDNRVASLIRTRGIALLRAGQPVPAAAADLQSMNLEDDLTSGDILEFEFEGGVVRSIPLHVREEGQNREPDGRGKGVKGT